ncbi:MAG: hypothetical protein AAF849_25110 [Bacteroidota bacterium]
MKKIILIFSIVLFFQHSRAQTTLSLYTHDNCSEKIELLSPFTLKKNGKSYYSVENTVTVLDSGFFDLYTTIYKDPLPYFIHQNRIIQDTLTIKTVELLYTPSSNPSKYYYACCENKCNGLQMDFYPNKIKRLEAYFIDGIPKRKLKLFYPNGNLKRIDKYRKQKLVKRIYYSENGKKKRKERF